MPGCEKQSGTAAGAASEMPASMLGGDFAQRRALARRAHAEGVEQRQGRLRPYVAGQFVPAQAVQKVGGIGKLRSLSSFDIVRQGHGKILPKANFRKELALLRGVCRLE